MRDDEISEVEISELIGKTFSKVKKTDNELLFLRPLGDGFKFFHEQDCCESVYIDDVVGDLNDLVGSPILQAEEISSEGFEAKDKEFDESFTWTFYKFATIKGSVTVKWYGSSNGNYSEAVDFKRI